MTWDVCRGDLREIGKIIGNPEEESGLTDVLRRAATVPNGRGRKLVEAFWLRMVQAVFLLLGEVSLLLRGKLSL